MFRQRATSAVIIVVSAVVPAILGHPVLTVAVVALASLGIIEFCRAARVTGATPGTIPSIIVGGLLILAVGFEASLVVVSAILALGILGLLGIQILSREISGSTRDWAYSVAGIFYVAVPLAHVPVIRDLGGGEVAAWVTSVNDWAFTDHPATGLGWLVLIVAVTWLTDTFAYLGGRAIGRIKLAPLLSPGKTIEGAACGVVFGALAGALVVAALGLPLPIYVGIGFGLLISITGQIGDLAESLMKRDFGVKDTGDVIPGHGGILDRIDALLFTLPVGYYLIRIALEINWP